jgi:hypothetical protein
MIDFEGGGIDFEGGGIDFEGGRGTEPRRVRARHTGMSHSRYRRGMPTARSGTLAGLLLVAAVTIAGCGGSTVAVGSGGHSSTATPTASGTSSDNAPTTAMVVVRTGGIAGVLDMVRIAADGTASITSKTAKSRACTPSGKDLDRLRAIDLSGLATTSPPPGMADGFNYSVKSGSTSATASEGDDDSRRAELVDAAAAVVASCLATLS